MLLYFNTLSAVYQARHGGVGGGGCRCAACHTAMHGGAASALRREAGRVGPPCRVGPQCRAGPPCREPCARAPHVQQPWAESARGGARGARGVRPGPTGPRLHSVMARAGPGRAQPRPGGLSGPDGHSHTPLQIRGRGAQPHCPPPSRRASALQADRGRLQRARCNVPTAGRMAWTMVWPGPGGPGGT
jgi:hypothetical protein